MSDFRNDLELIVGKDISEKLVPIIEREPGTKTEPAVAHRQPPKKNMLPAYAAENYPLDGA